MEGEENRKEEQKEGKGVNNIKEEVFSHISHIKSDHVRLRPV